MDQEGSANVRMLQQVKRMMFYGGVLLYSTRMNPALNFESAMANIRTYLHSYNHSDVYYNIIVIEYLARRSLKSQFLVYGHGNFIHTVMTERNAEAPPTSMIIIITQIDLCIHVYYVHV